MTATPKQIVCVKWGTLYGPEYVNRLYAMVKRNITGPFRLWKIKDGVVTTTGEMSADEVGQIKASLK
jgi:hypothetical protein